MANLSDMQIYVTLATTTLLWILMIGIKEVSGLGCFVCSSVNGSNPLCEDTFNATQEYYQPQCKGARKGRSGLFPGTECIKMKAELGSYTVVVRDCSVHNGDLTSDTEMGGDLECSMVNLVNYDNVQMHGCAVACLTDGCNTGSDVIPSLFHVTLGLCMALLLRMLKA